MSESGNHVCMNSDTSVSLREYIERIIAEHERSTQQALALAAKEYERRLEVLNGEAERLKQMQSSYVSQDAYDGRHREIEVRLTYIERLVWMGLGAVTVIGTVIQVVMHLLKG